MFRNYLKIALRNLRRNKLYSFINIAGLAVGLSVCILILLYVQFEWSFDTFNTKSDRIYRAWTNIKTSDGQSHRGAMTPLPLGQALKDNIPGVEATTRLYAFQDLVKTQSEAEGHTGQFIMADPAFFNIFDFKLLQGDRSTVFSRPNSIVLTPEMARRFFGNKDPLQQTLSIKIGEQYREFSVTGIIETPPANSSIRYQMLIPFSNANYMFADLEHSWFPKISSATYVLFQKGVQPNQLTEKTDALVRQELGDQYQKGRYTIGFQPLTDIHLDTRYGEVIASVTNPAYAYILAVIALLVLVIACVNFITLSVSQSTSRAKEIGIRKTIGAARRNLMFQSWGEALLITGFALALGVILSALFLPFFNNLVDTTLSLNFTWLKLFSIIGIAFSVSLMVGVYPALVLSGLHPSEILRGKLKTINGVGRQDHFHKGMVIFQFTLSMALIIATFIVHNQMNYVRTTNLGYNKDELVVLPSGFSRLGGLKSHLFNSQIENSRLRRDLLETKLQSIPGVKKISATVFTPVQLSGWYNLAFKDDHGQQQKFHFNIVDTNFLSTMGIKLLEGKGFTKNNLSDQQDGIIVNQALVRHFGWKNPIGKRLPGPAFENHKVIGVVQDFHYQSLYTPIEPLVLAMNPELIMHGINRIMILTTQQPRYLVRLHSDNLPATMNQLKKVWAEVTPGTPFDYTFVDQALDQQYRQSEHFSEIVTTGSILAIILACLGLFGLSSLMVVRRTKEIGIRKVLGASVTSVTFLLSRDFLQLVGIGFLIAIPIAWYFMNRWLQNFAYHIHIGIGIFALAGVLAMVIALLTVSWQSVRAAIANPVESIRNE